MSLQKNAAFRGGGELRPDERSFIWSQLANMSVDLSRCFIYPRMFSIHDMPPDAGTPATDGGADVSSQLLTSVNTLLIAHCMQNTVATCAVAAAP
jgi:hypothetical protein